MLRRYRGRVSGVFCINNDGKKIFEEEGFDNVRQMPLGFDPAVFFPDRASGEVVRRKHGFTKTVVAYFGRLIPEKGVHLLIQALQELKHLDWQLMMDHFDEYASDYHKEIKRAICESGIEDRVIFVHPDHVGIAAYMNAADIIVVPSVSSPAWKEQYGRVAAEGMACGTTIIASDSGALPELLNGHGLLFPEGDAGALAGMLEQCLSGQMPGMPDAGGIADYAREHLSIYRQKRIIENALQQ